MTNEEAIYKLKQMERDASQNLMGEISLDGRHREIELAMSALEKQIPKKPNLEGDGYADGQMVYDTWICPSCNHYYDVDFDDFDFCPRCGQKLDWSEEE